MPNAPVKSEILPVAIDCALLRDYANPAFLVDAENRVIEQNVQADGLLDTLEDSPLLKLINQARNGAKIFTEQVTVQRESGVSHYDLFIIPSTDDRVLVIGRDTSLERSLRSALVDSRQRFKDLVDISSDFAWEIGNDGRFSYVSPKGAAGYNPEDLIGKRSEDIIISRQGSVLHNPFVSDHRVENEEIWVVRADGEPACLLVSSLPLTDENDMWAGARGVCRDITEERERDAALARAYHRDQLLAYIVKTVRNEVDPKDMLGAAAKAIGRALGANGCQIFRLGYDRKTFELATVFGDVPSEHAAFNDDMSTLHEGETRLNSVETWRSLTIGTYYMRELNGAICLWKSSERGDWSDEDRVLLNDVANQLGIANEQISNHERILRLSRTDALTGLLNRRAFFEEELPRRLKRLRHNGQAAALLYVDLDHFKQVNDVFGHLRGDEILVEVRTFLEAYTRPGDALSRLGGDEFSIWYDGMDRETAINRAQKLIEDSKSLRRFSGSPEYPLGISVGLAIFDPDSGETLEELVSRADSAMYLAKKDGKGGFKIAADPKK